MTSTTMANNLTLQGFFNLKLTWVVDIPRSKFVEHCHGPRRVDSSGSDLSIVVAAHHVPKVPCGTGDFIVAAIILSNEIGRAHV